MNPPGDHILPQEVNEHTVEASTARTEPKFRFKSKRKIEDAHRSERSKGGHHDRERSSRHHHRRKRRRRSASPASRQHDSAAHNNAHPSDAPSESFVDHETAFRESLFDAMADDEAADYWQNVYGQPIHIYSDVKQGSEGILERMTDEEYTAYVRGKMYEKTHQHLIEEKARRDAARKQKERLAKDGRQAERAAQEFRANIEESLERGRERKSRRAWAEKWAEYIHRWEKLGTGTLNSLVVASIPWPVESGRRQDIEVSEVKRFFMHGPSGGIPTEQTLLRTLKLERVRWHPDKIQQKLGGQNVEPAMMQAVTEVFQIIDQVWSDLRGKT